MKVILSLALSLLFSISFAQGISSEGKDYYLAFINPSYNTVVNPVSSGYFRVFAYVSSLEDNTVSVSYFDQASSLEQAPTTYPIKARQTSQIPLDISKMKLTEYCETPRFLSCHITSKKPITVQYFSSGANAGGSYLALPVNAWGKDYVIASYKDNGSGNGAITGGMGATGLDKSAGIFVIVAAYDSTIVTIVPTAKTCDGHIGVNQGYGSTGKPVPYTVTLRRGQCYTVKSKSATDAHGEDDISASTVKSNKPVAVIAGHEDAFIDGGDVAGFSLEARDFMIEQMIPVEYWDHTGYITIPFIDSAPNNGEGVGDLARIFVSDKNVPTSVQAERGGVVYEKHPYMYLWPEDLNYSEMPVHFWTTDSAKKFSVVQYDIRNHSTQRTTPPFPSPSMMSIIPRSRWLKSYHWYVPSNINERLQAYYVTIIAPKDGVELYHEPTGNILKRNWFSDSIRVSANGSNSFTSTNGLGGQRKKWSNIPGHPDLQAVTYSVSPGTSYFVKSPTRFIVYHFGCRAIDYDGDLGDFDSDDHFYSYALPLGMSFSIPYKQRIGVTIDSLCAGWRICARDSNTDGAIRSVTLVGNTKNVAFSREDDPSHIREIKFDLVGQNVCFDIEVEDPGMDAFAPLYIVDVKGNGKLFELQYKAAEVALLPAHTEGLHIQHPFVGESMCRDYLIVNKSTSARSYKASTVSLSGPSRFKVVGIAPALRTLINPGDTMRVKVCFSAEDTAVYLDSVDIETDCFALHLPLVGQAGTPLILASDLNFGPSVIGKKRCADVNVKNIGHKPFTMDDKWVLDNAGVFSVDPLDPRNTFPVTIQPGASHTFWICYTPLSLQGDSATLTWSTDIAEPFLQQVKSFSTLSGTGTSPLVFWDRLVEPMPRGSSGDTISRVNIVNTASTPTELTGFWIDGPDADEFRIVATQSTLLPAGSSNWVDVGFKLNTSKLPLSRTRIAYLRTAEKSDPSLVPTIELRGFHATADVSETSIRPNISLRPNPARNEVTIELASEKGGAITVSIYDVLGREVLRQSFDGRIGVNMLQVELPELPQGAYIVAVDADGRRESGQLVIE